jgi:nicotinamide mononucleotide transporter
LGGLDTGQFHKAQFSNQTWQLQEKLLLCHKFEGKEPKLTGGLGFRSQIYPFLRIMDFEFLRTGLAEGLQQLSWLEGLAVFMGILSVYFSTKQHIWVYPTGIVSVLIYVWICFDYGLYADMGINAYYFGMSIYGWYLWNTPKKGAETLTVTWLDARGWLVSLTIFAVSYLLLVVVLREFTDSTVPYWDSFTTASAFVAMWLMAKKKVENWIFWILTDIVSIPLYFHKGLLLTSFQYLFFTALAIAGLLTWIKAFKTNAQA